MKRASCILLSIVILVSLAGCFGLNDFKSVDINLYGVEFTEVQADASSAYFLDKNGTLYCTGADSDGSAYVCYSDEDKGIVAKDVAAFGTMTSGGYYIDNNGDLFVWNKTDKPELNYKKSDGIHKLATDVKWADWQYDYIVYVDVNDRLYIVGSLLGVTHSINDPKLLSTDVSVVSTSEGSVLWYTKSGKIDYILTIDNDNYRTFYEEVKEQSLQFQNIKSIDIDKEYMLLLNNTELWFYGNYESIINGKSQTETQDQNQFIKLSDDITDVSSSLGTIVAIDSQANAKLWGKGLSNDDKNVETPEYKYYSDYIFAKNVKNVTVNGTTIGYIDLNNRSHIYGDGQWESFYGNSTTDRVVGLRRAPKTWVEE